MTDLHAVGCGCQACINERHAALGRCGEPGVSDAANAAFKSLSEQSRGLYNSLTGQMNSVRNDVAALDAKLESQATKLVIYEALLLDLLKQSNALDGKLVRMASMVAAQETALLFAPGELQAAETRRANVDEAAWLDYVQHGPRQEARDGQTG